MAGQEPWRGVQSHTIKAAFGSSLNEHGSRSTYWTLWPCETLMTKERFADLRSIPEDNYIRARLMHECLHEIERLQDKVAILEADKQRMAEEIYRLTPAKT
jgi:hypothetical protein